MKRRIYIGTVIILILLSMVIFYKYSQYIIVWSINPQVKVDGIKLMMTEKEVKQILGEPEEYTPGFGGYYLGYKSKGIYLTFLSDPGTDFYNKVSAIEVSSPGYYIYDVQVGQKYDDAIKQLEKYGVNNIREGYPGIWKSNMYVLLDKDSSGRIVKVSIKVVDKVSSTRIY